MLSNLELDRAATIGAVLVASLFIWALFRQRESARRFLSAYPVIVAIFDAVLIVLIAYSAQGILILLGTLPRFLDWQALITLGAELSLHIGWAISIARVFEGILTKRRAHLSDWRLSRLSRIGLYGIFLLIGIVAFVVASGNTPKELFVWTGASAAVLAFIMQQTLGDLFSGLSLTIERPFRIGDWLRLEDGTEGQVEDINWRTTRLRKWDKTTLVVPNGTMARETFTNLHGGRHVFAPWYQVKVSNEHPPALVIALMEQALRSCEIPMDDPSPVVRLLDASKTPYTYMVWVQFANYPTMFAGRRELYQAIDETLRKADIEIAGEIHEIRYRNKNPDKA